MGLKPGVHTNDFAPIYGRRANKLGHASLTTVFRPSRLTLPPILRENLESPVLRYQPITTAVVTDACLNTRWHHGAYTSAVLRGALGLDRVVTVYVVQSSLCTLNCHDPICSWQFSRVVNRQSREYVRRALVFFIQAEPYIGITPGLYVRKYSFSKRTVNEQNNLSADCVHSSSINTCV